MTRRSLAIGAALLALAAGPALARGPIRLLIVDGQNNHDWRAMTPPMKAALEGTGRFAVEVATTPPRDAPASAWDAFRPDFSKYDVVLSNYNGQPWPDRVNEALERFVEGGGGLVVVHAANNAFPGWDAWDRMIGLGWRDADYGDRVILDDSGQAVRVPKGTGPGAGHGPQHAYTVQTRAADHPITRGMPAAWRHPTDELYHGQRGPARDMTILATAYSSKDQGGTGDHEPIAWTIPFGKGRVFTTVLGHVGANGGPLDAIRCVGFRTLVARGVEWAATGDATLPLPDDFPTADEARLAPE